MSFPVNYSGYPTGQAPNPFMPADMSGVPGAFGAQPPMAMGVPGLFPGMDGSSMGMGGMGIDPFSTMGMPSLGIDPMSGMPMFGSGMGIDPMTGMPMGGSTGMPMGIDPMTGMPMGGSMGMQMGIDPMTGMPMGGSMGMQMGIDPMTGMPLGSGMGIDPMTGMPIMAASTGMPMGIDPMTGMPIGQPPFSGMQAASMGLPGMMPPMGGMAMDPFGGMGGAMGMPMGVDPMAGMPGSQPQSQQPQNPIKQMFMMLLQMKMFQQFMNPGAGEVTVDPASEEGGGEEVVSEVADNATALDILADPANFKEIGGADGNISFLDLSRAARTSKNEDVKAAADYITKQNPALFKQLEKLSRPGDGVFTEADLGKALQTTSIVQGDASTDSVHGGAGNDTLEGGEGNDESEEKITDNISALDAFASHFDELDENSNGQVTAAELSSAASSSDDPTLKKLAKYLRTKGLFSAVDELDEKAGVSVKDINDAMEDSEITQVEDGTPAAVIDVNGVTDETAVKSINQNFSIIDALKDPKKKGRTGISDGKLTVEDLDAVINSRSKDVTDDMKKAAQVMKNNSLIAKLDKSENADSNAANAKDGIIEKGTLQAWADDYKGKDTAAGEEANKPKDLKAAMKIISKAGVGNIFGDKKKFTIEDVRAAMNKDGVAADVKGALKYLIDNADKFDKLDKLDESDDGTIQVDVISDAADQGDDLNYFGGDATEEKNRQALTILDDVWDMVDNAADGGNTDEVISEEDLQAAISDRSGKYTAKQKAALAYIFKNRQKGGNTLWEAMDGDDDKIGKDAFQRNDLNGTANLNPDTGVTQRSVKFPEV